MSDRPGTELEARDPRGLAVLKHAISDGGKVLEFEQQEDGTILITDITEHVNRLEEQQERSSTSSPEQDEYRDE